MRKRTIMYFLVFFTILLIVSIFLVLCFRTELFSFVDVFFYRGIALIVFWGVIAAMVLAVLGYFRFKDTFLPRDVVTMFIVFCCVNLVFFTHVPVTADRSITVFVLGHMADHSKETFTEKEIEDYFIERYVKDYGAFEKRFHEQLETGTIEEVSPGEYQITESGRKLMKLYEFISEAYGIDDKLIHSDKMP